MHARHKTREPDNTAASTARKLRLRYTATGLCIAFTWIGEGNAPAWEHALRTLVILLMLPPLLLRANRHLTHKLYESAHPGRVIAQLITARIVIITAAFGTSNLLGRLLDPGAAHPPVLPAIGFALLLLSIPAQIRQAHRTRAHTTHPAAQPTLSAPRLMAVKLIKVTAALVTQLLLTPYLPNATFVVAAALFLTSAILGPKIHRGFLVTQPATTNEAERVAA
ncbi:hypothetical protein [Streptomyces sp. ISID311]|uniref:hypothetical protein n=1 Tax=Streptomyces sp. ISID311 TaxID=2601673 RepID=UPI0011BD3660|nr:hypothetical protein [Streptomyces sp. ISID311]TXC96054.1 hypothetical protein FS847_18930 [Streptomyces sp. ISID311]